MELPAVYHAAHGRVVDLVAELDIEVLARVVPGTPAWSVQELLAHLSGVAADLVAGNMDGAASDAWTARQVGERRGRSREDLLDEWERNAPAVETFLAGVADFHPFVVDVFTHEHDLRGALGLAGTSDAAVTAEMVGRVATGAIGPRLDKGGLPALRLQGDGDAWVAGRSEMGATVSAPTVELFRWLFGRRSAGQACRYGWEGDPSPFLPVANLFGAPPARDVEEAGAP